MAMFKSQVLLTGPYKARVGPMGQQMVPKLALGSSSSGFQSVGAYQLVITLEGWLVAPDAPTLVEMLGQIDTALAGHATPGRLELVDGRIWNGVMFKRFITGERVGAGREVTLSYTAEFFG